ERSHPFEPIAGPDQNPIALAEAKIVELPDYGSDFAVELRITRDPCAIPVGPSDGFAGTKPFDGRQQIGEGLHILVSRIHYPLYIDSVYCFSRSFNPMALKNSRVLAVLGLIVAAVLAYGADNRTKLKPGFNFFSPQEDVEIGRQSARQAERQ